jgi:heme-degrading monooxygenase HmoA
MILETALIHVVPGQEAEFLNAIEEAKKVLKEAKGWKSISVKQGIERPSTFMLQLEWETLENHTVDFREGPLFAKWRAIIGPFFASAPDVEHWTFH